MLETGWTPAEIAPLKIKSAKPPITEAMKWDRSAWTK